MRDYSFDHTRRGVRPRSTRLDWRRFRRSPTICIRKQIKATNRSAAARRANAKRKFALPNCSSAKSIMSLYCKWACPSGNPQSSHSRPALQRSTVCITCVKLAINVAAARPTNDSPSVGRCEASRGKEPFSVFPKYWTARSRRSAWLGGTFPRCSYHSSRRAVSLDFGDLHRRICEHNLYSSASRIAPGRAPARGARL